MKLLVGVDGSTESEAALTYALDLAEHLDGSVTAMHVVVPTVSDLGGDEPASLAELSDRLVREGFAEAERRGERVLDDAADRMDAAGITGTSSLVFGDPVHTIVDAASTGDFDGIVVGHRGRSGRAAVLLGSVAKTIVERATVPVTVVRADSDR